MGNFITGKSSARLATAIILFLLSSLDFTTAYNPFLPLHHSVTSEFNWTSIEPSKNLVYHDCYHNRSKESASFKCARLIVPLDWNNLSNPHRIALAIIKLEVKSDTNADATDGDAADNVIFWNPGGPGGSGVSALPGFGPQLQNIVDDSKRFSIISWDPRGVGFSGNIDCFNNSLQSKFWTYQQRFHEKLGWDDEAIAIRLASFQGRTNICMQKYDDGDDTLLNYMATAHTARDLLEISLREHELSRQSKVTQQKSVGKNHDQTAMDEEDETVRLNYLGSSYGTIIGHTFATLYPHHVGKMVLDGNMDADNWASKWWTTSLTDFEKIWTEFYNKCFLVKGNCTLWRQSDLSAHDIETRVQAAFDTIEKHPLPIKMHDLPDVVTAADLRKFIFESFYSATTFPGVAYVLNSILFQNLPETNNPMRRTVKSFSKNNSLLADITDANRATTCSDADPGLSQTNISEFRDYLAKTRSYSPTVGEHLAIGRLSCMIDRGHLQAKGRFAGPFGAKSGSMPTPILFINNRLDPVCPITNAHKMSKQYPGSVVLEQDAAGHCVMSASLGDCVKGHVRRYFNHGTLPPDHTVCPPGCEAFDDDCFKKALPGLFPGDF